MNLYLLKQYVNYWLHCIDEHSLHSPFVYDLYTKVIRTSRTQETVFSKIEELRQQLQTDSTIINTSSMGAPSTIQNSGQRTIESIARGGITSKSWSQLFYLLGSYFSSESIWELGTSIGLNTLYLSMIPNSRVTTFEGCTETLNVAKANFKRLGVSNIKAVEGDINERLETELSLVRKLDLVFFDANHRFEPTMTYFDHCLTKTHAGSIFIFDDIHWSAEMTRAWEQIIKSELAMITIDLFQVGLVFFDPDLPKQHFILDYPALQVL